MLSKLVFRQNSIICSNIIKLQAMQFSSKKSHFDIHDDISKITENTAKKMDEHSTMRKQEKITKKFSAFTGKERDYNITKDPEASMDISSWPKFEPKEEFTKIPFDPNIRHRLPTIPNHLMHRFMNNHVPEQEAQSQYVAVHHKGTTYHLFNAKRMPIGRISLMISKFIRGKHKPTYTPLNFENGDKCIVVNMSDPYMTGRKRQQKLYRHHTGYPGGLKEYTFRTILEKNPERILTDAIMGMLPKNSQRKDVIKKNVTIIRGPYHNMPNILPQFTEPLPEDINEQFGLKSLNPEDTVITYSSDGNIPEEFKDYKVEIDDSVDTPLGARVKTHTEDRQNFFLGHAYKKSYKNFRRFKDHRADDRK